MFSGLYQSAAAQEKLLFSEYADSIDISEDDLNNLISLKPKAFTEFQIADDFLVKAIVLSSLQKYENMKSMIMHCQNFEDAIFSLSKTTDEDDNEIFKGRILHSEYDDGYELRINENGLYYLRKIRVNNSISG
jgi:predicted hydrolase (HD superfamily)